MFGLSSEKTPVNGQLSFFYEAEKISDSCEEEPTVENVKVSSYKRILVLV